MENSRTLSRHDPLPRAPGAAVGLWIAHHEQASLVGQWLPVGERPLELGRGMPVGLEVLDDPRLSKRHARIERVGDSLQVVDLQSRNGTWVGGRQVEAAPLPVGQLLRVGDVLLIADRGGESGPQHPRILGVSPAIREVLRQIAQVAPHEATVLILGEPGTGKELVAREIHRLSGARGRFVALNCAGVGDPVLHSELFGHTRGAFTGAVGERAGLVREAEQGTLLFDEIGDASPSFQSSLLRLLQAGEARPVGSDRFAQAAVRFVAATNRDLDVAVLSGAFRADLRSRLEQWVIRVPPLRSRPIDIAVLFHRLARARAGEGLRVDPALVERLLAWDWPGNVREVEATVTRLAITHSPGQRWEDGSSLPTSRQAPLPAPAPRLDRDQLCAVLERHGGNVRAAAQELGIGRNTLYRRAHELELDLTTFRKGRS